MKRTIIRVILLISLSFVLYDCRTKVVKESEPEIDMEQEIEDLPAAGEPTDSLVSTSESTIPPIKYPIRHIDQNKIKFHEYKDYVSVYGYDGKESSVIIPDTYNGKNVNTK